MGENPFFQHINQTIKFVRDGHIFVARVLVAGEVEGRLFSTIHVVGASRPTGFCPEGVTVFGVL